MEEQWDLPVFNQIVRLSKVEFKLSHCQYGIWKIRNRFFVENPLAMSDLCNAYGLVWDSISGVEES